MWCICVCVIEIQLYPVCVFVVVLFDIRYGDGAGNTIEENSSVFSPIQMH